jgi:two-component system nitrogen regulation response regulator GlnG
MAMARERRNVLVVDDEEPIRSMLASFFETKGYRVSAAGDGREALRQIGEDPPHLVLLDLRMPEMDGMEALRRIRKLDRRIPVVVVTAYGAVETAVAAMKMGARDFLTKPLKLTELLRVVEDALSHSTVGARHASPWATQCVAPTTSPDERLAPPGSDAAAPSLQDLMGHGPAIAQVCELVDQVAGTDLTVVLSGETGTGKSLVAQAIHRASPRAAGRLVRVDCGAIPETLVESELFGHERGAFTGADRRNVGYFELADGGTLFLDEVANLSQGMMRKLLCALEDRRIYRVGGPEPIDVDIRVIAASNQDLGQLVEQGRFRRDLFHRLTEFTIELPPLRRRREDIPFLVQRFIRLSNEELGKNVSGPTEASLDLLVHQEWPGNARELRNIVKRAVLLCEDAIEPDHLRAAGLGGPPPRAPESFVPDLDRILRGELSLKDIARECVRHLEQKVIGAVLDHTNGNKSQAARLLNVDYKTLFYKAREMGQ